MLASPHIGKRKHKEKKTKNTLDDFSGDGLLNDNGFVDENSCESIFRNGISDP